MPTRPCTTTRSSWLRTGVLLVSAAALFGCDPGGATRSPGGSCCVDDYLGQATQVGQTGYERCEGTEVRRCTCTPEGYASCSRCAADPGLGSGRPSDAQVRSLEAMCMSEQGGGETSTAPIRVRILAAQLATDGSTDVTLGVELESGAQPSFHVERATSESGPYTRVATLSSSTRTYLDASMPSPRAFYRAVIASGSRAGETSRVVPAFAIARARYELERQTVPGVPFVTSLVGEIRGPVDSGGSVPLVLFLHGNHGTCRPADYGTSSDDLGDVREEHTCRVAGSTTTPNEMGYVYLQEQLAARGYVTVSISANALNIRNDRDGWIEARASLIREHLRRWAEWGRGVGAPWTPRLTLRPDLQRVGLVGHSRGGEAVSRAAALDVSSPITGVDVRSVLALAPTDFNDPVPGGAAHAVLAPSCDGDVFGLDGIDSHDRSRLLGDGAPRTTFLVVGANHNFFNTEWRFPDSETLGNDLRCGTGDILSPAQARATAQIVVADWIDGTLRGRPADLPGYVRGERDVPPTLAAWASRTVDVRTSYSAGDRRVIERFERTPSSATTTGYDVAQVRAGTGDPTSGDVNASLYALRHALSALRLSSTRSASTTFSLGSASTAGHTALALRLSGARDNPTSGAALTMLPSSIELTVRVRDAAGASATVRLSDAGGLDGPHGQGIPWAILQTVRIPLSSFRGVDTASLRSVELVQSLPQELWVSDIELARD